MLGKLCVLACLSVCLFYFSITYLSYKRKRKLPLVNWHGFEEVLKEKWQQIKNVEFDHKSIQMGQHRI